MSDGRVVAVRRDCRRKGEHDAGNESPGHASKITRTGFPVREAKVCFAQGRWFPGPLSHAGSFQERKPCVTGARNGGTSILLRTNTGETEAASAVERHTHRVALGLQGSGEPVAGSGPRVGEYEWAFMSTPVQGRAAGDHVLLLGGETPLDAIPMSLSVIDPQRVRRRYRLSSQARDPVGVADEARVAPVCRTPRRYGKEVREGLIALGGIICSKRLKPLIPVLVPRARTTRPACDHHRTRESRDSCSRSPGRRLRYHRKGFVSHYRTWSRLVGQQTSLLQSRHFARGPRIEEMKAHSTRHYWIVTIGISIATAVLMAGAIVTLTTLATGSARRPQEQ